MTKESAGTPRVPGEPSGVRDLIRVIADLVSLLEPQLLEVWRSTGMTFSQRRVLRQLRDGPRSAGDVAASAGISAPTLTRLLARLEEHHYITRSMDGADRRKVLVELTAEGARVLAGHRVFAGSPIAHAAGDLTGPQRQALIDNLGLLVKRARELDPVEAGD